MDEFDRNLLRLLQTDSRRTSEDLAREVGLSPSAVQRRVRRLREDGYIEREVAILSPKAVGRPLLMLVLVSLERDRGELVMGLANKLARLPEVVQCHALAGDSDIALLVSVASMDEYSDFVETVLSGEPNVRNVRTCPVMRRVKSTLELPLS